MKFFAKKYRGSVAIEAALTFPVVCYLIFFILEIMKVNDTQIAVDSISVEMAVAFMASRNTDNFDDIIAQYKPPYISQNKITWYFSVYDDLSAMNNEAADSSDEVYWPSNSQDSRNPDMNAVMLTDYQSPEKSFNIENSDAKFRTLSGKAFILIVVCDYQFSSDFVKRIFTSRKQTEEGKYLVHGKCAGVCS
jgi:Flp pilus assembly protein TadG